MRGAASLPAWLIASSRLGDQYLLFSIFSSLLFKTTQGEHRTSLVGLQMHTSINLSLHKDESGVVRHHQLATFYTASYQP